MSPLRTITLAVRQDNHGQFTWMLHKSIDETVAVEYDKNLSYSLATYPTDVQALDAAVTMWKSLCTGQLQYGPRSDGQDDAAIPAGVQDNPILRSQSKFASSAEGLQSVVLNHFPEATWYEP
ncbi:MAG: hypothetical protein ABIQ90_01490 [Polaromonas sp.]